MKKFRHLDWSDRLCIEKCYNAGKSCFEIARLLGLVLQKNWQGYWQEKLDLKIPVAAGQHSF